MDDNTRETLELFVEKAALMRERAFWRFFQKGGEISFSFMAEPNTQLLRNMTFMGQDAEARDALLVTLRFFLQDNESISLRNMAKLPMSDAGLSSAWIAGFARLHREINRFLDDPAEGVGQEIGLPGLTSRQVLETCLYGEIAHANPSKRMQYKAWRSLPTFPLVEFTFSAIVSTLLCTIFNAAELAEAELALPSAP